MKMPKVLRLDYRCSKCNAKLYEQEGFNPKVDTFECSRCGCENDIKKQRRFGIAKRVGTGMAVVGTAAMFVKSALSDYSDDYESEPLSLDSDKPPKTKRPITGERFPDIDWFCDNCNAKLNKQHGFDDHKYIWQCDECGYKSSLSWANIREDEEDYDDEDSERLDVYDAADIWASNGFDEDYTFGYTEEELQAAFDK